jgi:DNA polymerase-1
MLKVADKLKSSNLTAKILLQVHDELVLEAPEKEIQEVVALVQSAMEGVYSLEIPLTTDAKTGLDWGSLTV